MAILTTVGNGLYYSEQGEGTSIIFVHPPLLTSANFAYQVEGLSREFKVITFDIRGHGRSPYSEQTLTYQLIADDMMHLLNRLGIEKTYLCGYSTGGAIILEFLLRHPNRALGGIIVSGMSEVGDSYNKRRISIARFLTKTGGLPILGLSVSWSNSDTIRNFKNIYREALKGNRKNIEQYYHACLEYNCTNQLHTIDKPVLLVYGEGDRHFQRYAKILHKKLPNNEVKFINEKHRIPTKSAAELNQFIREFIEDRQQNSLIKG
ncbi:alpha/beta hydrolase [Bacillus sp. 1P10SD]|uniref:alpha/beta fold hydrolase n=1 Tax=Bacillus sp. 1P10SD TaxID=3132265 RepID=UPI0039A4C4AC